MSKLYFPLQSSVEFFHDPLGIDAGTRAKEGAVLYEQIIFEDGLFMATVGDDINFAFRRPRRELSDEDLLEPRSPGRPGEEVILAIGANQMRTVVQQTFTAQWHSVAIDELADLEVSWAAIATPSQETLNQIARPTSEAAIEFAERARLTTDFSRSQIDFAAKSLARDGIFAAAIGAAINVTPMFAPLIESVESKGKAHGSTALAVAVPSIGHLSWEAIAEFRERPGSIEAREMLRSVEDVARDQEHRDAESYLRTINASIMDAMAGALIETDVNLSRTVGREAVGIAVSFIPIVGPVVGPAIGIAEALHQRAEQRANGIYALMTLRRGSTGSQ
jgi:hypothetical protein